MIIENRSPALRNFWQNLKEISTLMNLCKGSTIALPKRRVEQDSLCRAAIVLLCSHMEGFFERLVEDILRFHELNATSIVQLSIDLRVVQVWSRSKIVDSTNTQDRWKFIRQVHTNRFVSDGQVCTAGMFDLELHTKGFASPGSSEVGKLFCSVGVNNIWQTVQQETGSSTLMKSLNGLVNRRNNIAHGSLSDKPTLSDIKVSVQDMCKLVIVFNFIVFKHLAEDFGATSIWI